jgi:hypothetical protein
MPDRGPGTGFIVGPKYEGQATDRAPVPLLRSWTCGVPPMYSPLAALTLTAYILTRTDTRLLMLTDRLTYAY